MVVRAGATTLDPSDTVPSRAGMTGAVVGITGGSTAWWGGAAAHGRGGEGR